jgi:hypothetical protein
MFRFDIDPEDLRALVAAREMKKVAVGELPNPDDSFKHPFYLPIDDEEPAFYQWKDKNNNLMTLKINQSRTHAIFRRESSRFYEERQWEKKDEWRQERLDRLRQEWQRRRKAN